MFNRVQLLLFVRCGYSFSAVCWKPRQGGVRVGRQRAQYHL